MRTWAESIGPHQAIDIVEYESGDYRFRILVPMEMTRNLGPDSEYRPLDPALHERVACVIDKLQPWRYNVPGGWDIRDQEELDWCIDQLRDRTSRT